MKGIAKNLVFAYFHKCNELIQKIYIKNIFLVSLDMSKALTLTLFVLKSVFLPFFKG